MSLKSLMALICMMIFLNYYVLDILNALDVPDVSVILDVPDVSVILDVLEVIDVTVILNVLDAHTNKPNIKK